MPFSKSVIEYVAATIFLFFFKFAFMYDALFNMLGQQVQLSAEDIELFKNYFEPIVYPKNTVVEPAGKLPQYLYYIVKGFVRLFHFNENGNEITTHINCPPGFIAPYADLVNQTRTNDNVECITKCELLRISGRNLNFLTEQSNSFKNLSIWVFQQSMAYNENRAKELTTLTAEQRYKRLLETYPDMIRSVPVQYIASFLGMKPESLSRIRRQLIT